MQIIEAKLPDINLQTPSALALGMFDGVHLGHQKVIAHAKVFAETNSLQTGVITLKKHPKELTHRNLKEKDAPLLLTNLETRFKIFQDFGIDFVLVIDFDEEFMNTSALDYLNLYLKDKLNSKFISVGYDHHFGKNRSGNIHLLETWSQENDIELKVQEPYQIIDTVVSSSLIRQLISKGKIKEANQYLGYDFRYIAQVIHGKKQGQQLGFPTANLEIDRQVQLPAFGVYKGYCQIENNPEIYKVAINYGVRPSIDNDDSKSLELHLIDFSGDLYGKKIDLRFTEKIRDEQKFSNLEDLKKQIKEDIALCMN